MFAAVSVQNKSVARRAVYMGYSLFLLSTPALRPLSLPAVLLGFLGNHDVLIGRCGLLPRWLAS